MANTRVLVVESEDDVRGVIAGFLQRKGYMVQAVADGDAATVVLAGPPPEVVVLRVTLADGRAPALVRAINALEPPAPALVLTGSKANADEFSARVAVADALYLLKPFGGNELLRAVESALAQRSARLQVAEGAHSIAASGGSEAGAFDDDFGSLLGEAPQGAGSDSPWPPPPPPRPSAPLPPPVVSGARPLVEPPKAARSPEFGTAATGPIPLLNPPPLRAGPGLSGGFEPPDDSVEGDWTDFARSEVNLMAPTTPAPATPGTSAVDPWGRAAPAPDAVLAWGTAAAEGWDSDHGGGWPGGVAAPEVGAPKELSVAPGAAHLDGLLDGGLGEDVRFGMSALGSAGGSATAGGYLDGPVGSVEEVEAPPQLPVEDERALRLQPMVADEAQDPRGLYGEATLAEVLVLCQRDEFTGRLVLLRGPVRKSIRLVGGRLVGGSSNLRGESVRAVLRDRRWVPEAVLQQYPGPDGTLLAALTSAAHLTRAQAAETEQARLIGAVLEAFGWSGGQYGLVYDPTVADRAHGEPLEVAPLVMRGLLGATPIGPVVRFFDQRVRETARITLRFETEATGLGLEPRLLRFTRLLDGRQTLAEVLASAPVGLETTLRLLRGLEVLGCVTFGPAGTPLVEAEAPRSRSERPAASQPNRPPSTGVPLERLDDFDTDWVETGFRAIATSTGPAMAASEAPRWEAGTTTQVTHSGVAATENRAGAGQPAVAGVAPRAGIYRSGPARTAGPSPGAPAAAAGVVQRTDSSGPKRPDPPGSPDASESRRPRPARGEGLSAGPSRRGLAGGSTIAPAAGTVAPAAGSVMPGASTPAPTSARPGTSAPRPGSATVGPRGGADTPPNPNAEAMGEVRPNAPAPLSPARLRALLEVKHAGLSTLDHYTLLEVAHEASPEEIGAAYRRLSRDIHQAATFEPKLFEKATEVGRGLAEAAQVLSDRRKRAHYDAITLGNLAGPALETDVAGAAAAFGRGKACLDRRDLPEAYEHLDRAMRLDPSAALYRMYAAFARFRLSYPKHRKAAVEAHEALKAALLDDGTQDEGFVLMALIYREIANNDMAARFYRKALSINRANRQAQEGMASLGLGEELQTSGVFGRLFGRKA